MSAPDFGLASASIPVSLSMSVSLPSNLLSPAYVVQYKLTRVLE